MLVFRFGRGCRIEEQIHEISWTRLLKKSESKPVLKDVVGRLERDVVVDPKPNP